MFYILIIIAIVVLDTKIKTYMEKNRKLNEQQKIFKGKIILRKCYNRGMFLNFMEEKRKTVRNISCVCLGIILFLFALVIPKKGHKLFKLGLSMVIGGAISNVSDRINKGYVVDYFSFNCKKLKTIIFNLSDIFVFLGSALILLSSVLSERTDME